MGHSTCCVVGCKNTGRNGNYKFYRFPTADHTLQQGKKWISAVKRKNADGTLWKPKKSDRICSQHFIGGAKSANQYSPSYAPTIFPSAYMKKKVDAHAAISRHTRFMNRRQAKQLLTDEAELLNETQIKKDENNVTDELGQHLEDETNFHIDQSCQVVFIPNCSEPSPTFICNRYIYENSNYCDAETQTVIIENTGSMSIPNQKKYCDKKYDTPKKTFEDQAAVPDGVDENFYFPEGYFAGCISIKNDNQLFDLAGVTCHNFKFLLKRMPETEKWPVTKENRLLILLLRLKTGLSFSAMAVLFSVNKTTVSKIFFETLQHLACATKNLVFWPTRDIVQGTMPECFKSKYSDTRVLIDCTEFRIDVPAGIDNRALTYSICKKGFSAKLLIGITPGGFISFKSKVAGGSKCDSELTIESGLLDLLEDGDVVLANKRLTGIEASIDERGKNVIVVMPPFLEKQSEFTEKETEETYSTASVSIHVEGIIKRLRIYQILSKIPENLFCHIDDVVHLCCVLVNLQLPIVSDKETSTNYQ